jgi:hypothetical protein
MRSRGHLTRFCLTAWDLGWEQQRFCAEKQHVAKRYTGPLIWSDFFGKTKAAKYGNEIWNFKS